MGNRDYDNSRWESDRYDRSGNDRRHDHEGRDWFNRAGDEVRSWFGDDDAERRRNMDERRDDRSESRRERFDYDNGSDYRHNYGTQPYDSDRVRRDLEGDRREHTDYGRSRDPWRDGSRDNENRWRQESQRMSGNAGWGGERDWNDRRPSSYGADEGAGYRSQDRYSRNTGYESHDHGYNQNTDRGYNVGGPANLNEYNVGYNREQSHDRSDYRTDRDGRRDWSDRAGDEVRSWFGDDRAESRRRMDERRDDSYDNRRDSRMW